MDLMEVHDRLFQFCRRNIYVFGEGPDERIERSLIQICDRGPVLPHTNSGFTEELSLAHGFYPILLVSFNYTFLENVPARDALSLFHGIDRTHREGLEHTYTVFYLRKRVLDRFREEITARLVERGTLMCYEDQLGMNVVFPFRKGDRLRHFHFSLDPLGPVGTA